jgi:hypothetical protein
MTNSSSTRITLTRDDLNVASSEGLITAGQADALWQRWSVLQWQHKTVPVSQEAGHAFGFTNVLYYFGAMMFWAGLSLRDSSNDWGKFAY